MLPKQLRFLHPYLHATGLLLMVVGLPFSMLLMSLSQFFIGGNWILEGDYTVKWKRFRSNKIAIMLCCLFLLYLPTTLWSSNADESLKVLRINLPLLIFPCVIGSSKPLPSGWYFNLMRVFVASVVLSTVVCAAIGLPQWINGTLNDIRHISLFISHIRFALLIVLAIFLCIWMVFYQPFRLAPIERVAYILAIIWCLFFMVILQSLNGFIVLLGVGLLWLVVETKKKLSAKTSFILTALCFAAITVSALLLVQTWKSYFTPATIYNGALPERSRAGNLYRHQLDLIENGYYINSFVCETELHAGWASCSNYGLDSSDLKGHSIKTTLIRYLNSKGLSKDAEGIKQLTKTDIQNIENGIANVKYAGLWGLRMRFYQLMYEYSFYQQGGKNASGHSLLMKWEFWKTGLNILLENPIMGVGIGDVPDAFRAYYQKNNTWLTQDWWMTCHNQYLYFGVAGGIPLLILFLFFFLTPAFKIWRTSILPFKLFLGISLLAMTTEDMLTTQAGVSFIAFFYSFFAFSRFSKEEAQNAVAV